MRSVETVAHLECLDTTCVILWYCYCMQSYLSGPLLVLSHCVQVVVVLGSPILVSVLQMLSHKCWIERNNHFPWPAGSFGSVQLAFLAWMPCWFNLSTWTPTFFYAKLLSSQSVPQPVLVRGVTPSQGARFCVCLCRPSQRSAHVFSLLRSF